MKNVKNFAQVTYYFNIGEILQLKNDEVQKIITKRWKATRGLKIKKEKMKQFPSTTSDSIRNDGWEGREQDKIEGYSVYKQN